MKIQSEKPLKYMLNKSIKNYVPKLDIDVSSTLRQEPTNLNYYNRAETPLYGTAPFKGRGTTEMDVESVLIQGHYSSCSDRRLTERQFPISNQFLREMNVVDFRPESTTVNSKNLCYKRNILNINK